MQIIYFIKGRIAFIYKNVMFTKILLIRKRKKIIRLFKRIRTYIYIKIVPYGKIHTALNFCNMIKELSSEVIIHYVTGFYA